MVETKHTMETEDALSITKNPINGSYVVSDIIDGHLVTRTYYGYTKKECKRMFRNEFKHKEGA